MSWRLMGSWAVARVVCTVGGRNGGVGNATDGAAAGEERGGLLRLL